MTCTGYRYVNSLDELGLTAVGEPVDHLVDDRHDEVVVPVREHPLAERLGDERAQPPVLGLVHPDERVRTHHDAHELADAAGAERLVVAHHRGDVVVRVDLVQPSSSWPTGVSTPLAVEVRVRVADVARDARRTGPSDSNGEQVHRRGQSVAPVRLLTCVSRF